MRVLQRALALLALLLIPGLPAGPAPAPPSTPPAGRLHEPLPEIAVPLRTARRLGVRAGDIVEVAPGPAMAGARRFRVAVVWDPAEHPADVARGQLRVRLHLPDLEELLARGPRAGPSAAAADVVDRIVIRLRNPATAPEVRDDLAALGTGFDAYTAGELVAHASRTFLVISRFHRAIGAITLLASGIFLVTIMALKLTEMRREIGALRLMGIGRGTVALTVMLIATAVAVLGGALGIGLGTAMVWAINAYYQPLFDTGLRFAILVPGTLAGAVALAVALGILAGAAVAVRLLRRHPLEQVGR